MIPQDSQILESYVPVYDEMPGEWKDAKGAVVEQLKRLANAVNFREIGFFLDEELLSGKAFIPGINNVASGNNSQQFRTILRKVIDIGPLVVGANPGVDHGILFDNNFTLIEIWVSGTDSATLTARNITGNNVLMNATQVVISSPQIFDRAFCVIEYIQEL